MITDAEAYARNAWCWKSLEDALPGKCAVTDIDGAIERGGHLFILEGKNITKCKSFDQIGYGQQRTFKTFVMHGFHVLFLYGFPPNKPLYYQLWQPYQPQPGELTKCEDGEVDIMSIVQQWFETATDDPWEQRTNKDGSIEFIDGE